MIPKRTIDKLPNDEQHMTQKKRKGICILCGPTDNIRCRFPNCEKIRKEWIQFCQAVPSCRNLLNPETSRLCHAHFKEDNIRRNKAGSILGLTLKAIPTIYTLNEISRPEDSARNSALDFAVKIKTSFSSIMLNTRKMIQCSEKMSESHDSTNFQSAEDSILELRQHDENEVQNEENLPDLCLISNSSPPRTPNCVYSTTSSSPPKGSHFLASTPSGSHQHRSIARPHAIRYIKDIRVADLESPRSRQNCVSVMHYESQVMRNKVQNLQRQNTRLKKKVQDLKEALTKLRKGKSVSSGSAVK